MTIDAFQIIVWIVAGLALLMMGWALAWDRLRRLYGPTSQRAYRRCPKCWYDMRHTPGMTCSECGYTAKRERALRKSRHRWWWACAGCIIILAATKFTFLRHDVRERGWIAIVPTTVLIAGLPNWEYEELVDLNWPMPRFTISPGSSPFGSTQFSAYEELRHRIQKEHTWWWQDQLVLHRCEIGDPARSPVSSAWKDFYLPFLSAFEFRPGSQYAAEIDAIRLRARATIRCPKRWVRGEPLAYRAYLQVGSQHIRWRTVVHTLDGRAVPELSSRRTPVFNESMIPVAWTYTSFWPRVSSVWDDDVALLDVDQMSTNPLRLHVQHQYRSHSTGAWHDANEETISVNIFMHESIDEALRPVRDDQLEETLRASDLTYLYTNNDIVYFRFPVRSIQTRLAELGNPAFAVTVELLDGRDHCVASGEAWWSFGGRTQYSITNHTAEVVILQWIENQQGAVRFESLGEVWRVRVSSKPALALRDDDVKYYWEGSVIMNVPVKGIIHVTREIPE